MGVAYYIPKQFQDAVENMRFLYKRSESLHCSPAGVYYDFVVLADSGKLVEGGDVRTTLEYNEYCVGR